MEVKLQKWGNSYGIRIPNNFLKSLNLKQNDIIILEQIDDKIVLSIPKKKTFCIEEAFEKYNGENLAKDFEWDDASGREIW